MSFTGWLCVIAEEVRGVMSTFIRSLGLEIFIPLSTVEMLNARLEYLVDLTLFTVLADKLLSQIP